MNTTSTKSESAKESEERHQRATHEVLDLHYHPEEGQGCYCGTYEECLAYADTQSPRFMYEVAPIIHPNHR